MLRYVVVLTLFSSALLAADPVVDRKVLKPGLVASFTEMPERPQTTTTHRLEPAVALLLKPGDSMHPNQSRTNTATWRGYIQIVTPGEYTFSANGQAGHIDVKLLKDDILHEVLVVDAPLTEASLLKGKPVKLESGFYRFAATFDYLRGKTVKDSDSHTRRFELQWEGPGFQREPIPYFFFGHLPGQRGEKFASDAKRDEGRFLFEELACIKCHQPQRKNIDIVERTGPDLTKIGARAYPGWLDAWLADPAKLRPHTSMPKMFTDDAVGHAERYAVVQYLLSHGGPLPEFKPPKIDNNYSKSLQIGSALFSTTGCAACHGTKLAGTMKKNDDDDEPAPLDPLDSIYSFGSATGAQSLYTLGGIGSKTTPEELAKYLKDPLKTNPHGRMPAMALSTDEARDIARHLMRYTEESIESRSSVKAPAWKAAQLAEAVIDQDSLAAFEKLKPAQQWRDLGQRLFISKGCANCHSMEEQKMPVTARSDFPSLEALAKSKSGGCAAADSKSITYKLTDSQRRIVTGYAKQTAGSDAPSPAYQTRAALKRFNCLNCHLKDGEGGLGNELADAMKKLDTVANEDDVQPPRLTGIGHKATSNWLHSVMVKGERARPWMTLRMPQYGESNVQHLIAGLPACEGLLPDVMTTKPKVTAAQIDQGRKLVGKEGLGCAACHDISGYVGAGTRGPDLALTDKRVRQDWYGRWMHNPQRLAPGTKMPSNFTDGKSVSNLLNADADAQIAAIWSYLSLGPGLPLPSGLEPPGKGLPLIVKDRPEVLRTFMPDGAGTRSIAVGYPNGAGSFAFDSHAARVAYAWEGNFLDLAVVWDKRGGGMAKLLGSKYLVAPPGQPWAVTDGEVPDYKSLAENRAFGAPVPFSESDTVPMRVHFDGYSLDTAGAPTFRYRVDTADGKASVSVSDTPTPRRSAIASGLQRNLTIERPAGKTVWFLVGASTKAPRNAGDKVVLPQAGDRALVLHLHTSLPQGHAWEIADVGDFKYTILKLPATAKATTSQLSFTVWALPRDDDALLGALDAK